MPIGTQVHMVKKHFTDGWGHEWFEGGYILQGLRYERLCPHNRSYYLLGESPPTYVYSHLVVASKFTMPPTTHAVRGSLCTYELSSEVLVIIHESISS
jgi:hypothetical protein